MEAGFKETQQFVQETSAVQEKLLKTILKKLSREKVSYLEIYVQMVANLEQKLDTFDAVNFKY